MKFGQIRGSNVSQKPAFAKYFKSYQFVNSSGVKFNATIFYLKYLMVSQIGKAKTNVIFDNFVSSQNDQKNSKKSFYYA